MRTIETSRLLLEPLVVRHAERMFAVLKEPRLHAFLDSGPPRSVEELRERYARLEGRLSPDGSQAWLNWVLVLQGQGPIGFVQATVAGATAWIAFLVAAPHWSHGYAAEATSAMLGHLASDQHVSIFRATAEVANVRSIALLQRLGFSLANSSELASLSLSPTECSYVLRASIGPHGT